MNARAPVEASGAAREWEALLRELRLAAREHARQAAARTVDEFDTLMDAVRTLYDLDPDAPGIFPPGDDPDDTPPAPACS